MMATSAATSFPKLVHLHVEATFHVVFRLTLDRDRAVRYTRDIFAAVARRSEWTTIALASAQRLWMLRQATELVDSRLPKQPEINFDILDETLRGDATRTDVVRSLTDPQRDFLLWELKQGCMTAVVHCLPPGERAAFVLSMISKLADDEVAAVLGVTESAFRVRLSRAKQKVGDYLAPRCEHVNPMNPCRCPARVGNAVERGFIRPQGQVSLRKSDGAFGRYGAGSNNEDEALRDIGLIYASLPTVHPPDGFAQEIIDTAAASEAGNAR
jgi:DNA-directed RNA polymerase specialized sigma24 family protein